MDDFGSDLRWQFKLEEDEPDNYRWLEKLVKIALGICIIIPLCWIWLKLYHAPQVEIQYPTDNLAQTRIITRQVYYWDAKPGEKNKLILAHYYDTDETDGVTSLQPMKYVDETNAIITIEYIPREQSGKMLINYKLPQISLNVCTWEYTKMRSEEE